MGDNLVPKSSESSNTNNCDYLTSKFVVTTIIFLQQKHTMVTKMVTKSSTNGYIKSSNANVVTIIPLKRVVMANIFYSKTYNGDKKLLKSCGKI